jgi:acetyltransferase-like isoleucine patch superfamily enzyme
MRDGWLRRTLRLPRRALVFLLRPIVLDIVNTKIRVWGDPARVHIAKSAHMMNTLFNVSAGSITVGESTFAGHNVSIITGTHDYNQFMEERKWNITRTGRDIRIGKGVWLGSNAVILGPCKIGDHAVIAACALVLDDVPPYAVVAGIPARVVRKIDTPIAAAGE